MFCKKFSISLYMDTSHLSRITPWEDATAFRVTGILLFLMTTLDFLSAAFFLNWTCFGRGFAHDEQFPCDVRYLENLKDMSHLACL